MTKIKSIRSDPRWPAFVAKYRYDWVRFAVEVIGLEPTHQQRLLMSEVQEPGCRVSCVSGHGTGKSSSTAIMILCFELCFIKARTVVIANNSRQVQIGIWKNLRDYWNEATKRFPWLAQYYVLTETQFFEKSCKTSWSVSAKSCRLGHEEALAGEHSKYLLNVMFTAAQAA